MCWTRLPDVLQTIIMDFYGDSSVRTHRRHRFLRCELKFFFLLLNRGDAGPKPRQVHRLVGRNPVNSLKHTLQLAYLQAEREALLKHHTAAVAP